MARKRPQLSMYPDMVKTAALTVAGKTQAEIASALGLSERVTKNILSKQEVREMIEVAGRMVAQACIPDLIAYHKSIVAQAIQDLAVAQEFRNHGNHRMARRVLAEMQPYLRLSDCAAQRLGQATGLLPGAGAQTLIQQNLSIINGNQIIAPGIAQLLSQLNSVTQQPAVQDGKTADPVTEVDVEAINQHRGDS